MAVSLSRHTLRNTLFAALLGAAVILPALAVPVMDMRAEDLLPMAAEFRKSLNLNANQTTLWQQTENKTRQLLRERQSRRERLQAANKAGVEKAGVELRELNAALDVEDAATVSEEKQLREWWLIVNDALDETQRQAVAGFLAEQLLRNADGGERGAMRGKSEGGEHKSGGGRGRSGGGSGGPGGPGGAAGMPGG
ncbi:hypothetical protein HSX11_23610 [Oxalobacteraceae bacterium]|nr:hypothetical protein [Oxalobacteraceae bacterium]